MASKTPIPSLTISCPPLRARMGEKGEKEQSAEWATDSFPRLASQTRGCWVSGTLSSLLSNDLSLLLSAGSKDIREA